MTLQQRAEEIAGLLEQKKEALLQMKVKLAQQRADCLEEYRQANTGDRSENAPLEAAIKHMQETNAAIVTNSKQLEQLEDIADLSRYNSVGIVVMYSTVRLSLDGKELIYRIYPDGVSFVDIGVIAANSRLATALMGKVVGDSVDLDHISKNTTLTYRIEEIY